MDETPHAKPDTLVERFYSEVWNRCDHIAAQEILAPDLEFRGSLGFEKHGLVEFLDYVNMVHAALGEYDCLIVELVHDGQRAAARMKFTGIHRGAFFGVAPTQRTITWCGAAFFDTLDGKITKAWVLGDIEAIKRALGIAGKAGNAFFREDAKR